MAKPDRSQLQSLSVELSEAVAEAARGVVAIRGGRTAASGIAWRDGIVACAEEALDDVDAFTVTLVDGSSASAHLAGRDPSTDVALLKVDGVSAPAWQHANMPPTGAIALAVGRSGSGPLAAFGIVAMSGGEWNSALGGKIDAEVRLSFALPKAIEGGAVIAPDGSLVGLAATGPRRQGLVIPVSNIERTVAVLLEKGYVPRGFLGVSLHTLGSRGRDGALVTEISEGGPADQAGLMVGDIITTWNGDSVRNGREIWSRLGIDAVGTTVALGIIRGGQPVEVRVSVGERRAPAC